MAKRQKRNVKLIFPSTITTFSMVFGMIAILAATNGQINTACYLLMFSILMDGLDGKVARMTNTASEFGVQYDSLSDMVAFGVAPCIIYSRFFLHRQVTDQVYYLLPIMYLTCSAIRLARFNVTASIYGKGFFTGLPTPAAAFMVALWPPFTSWTSKSEAIEFIGLAGYLSKESLFRFSIFLMITLSMAMISSVKFDIPSTFWLHKFKKRWLNYFVIACFLALIFIDFSLFAIAISAYYLISMFLRALFDKIRKNEVAPEVGDDIAA